MRESMSRLTPRFSANRAVREYTEEYYLPAAAAYHERAIDHGAYGRSLLKWRQVLAEHWASVRFGDLRVKTSPEKHSIEIEVYLGKLRSDWVRVELYADALEVGSPFIREMTQRLGGEPAGGWSIYAADIPASRPASDYTPRIIPSHCGMRVPLEDAHIKWLR
jgi:starch phosphorylase